MINFADLFASLALLLAVPVTSSDPAADVALTPPPKQQVEEADKLPIGKDDWLGLDTFRRGPLQHQVRIQQRVIIRITPPARAPRQSLMAEMRDVAPPTRFRERKMGKCVPIGSIAGVQSTRDNKLLLYLRDRRIVTANLEKACRARDFYSGFYVEPNEDGKLCVDRDKLQSRSGANCEVDRMRELVSVRDDR